jgi:two-component system sensor histidine kinase BaeS
VVAKELMRVTGRPVRNAAGQLRAMAYVLPREPEVEAPATDLRADARRTLWISVALASAVAAALALLLARPLVGQVSRLAAAAERVRAGDLGARVLVRSADELGRMEHAFNAMAAALQQAEAHKRNLVHDVAHELRTPLTNIVGILEAIEDGLRVPDPATCATLRAEAGLLAGLVHDLQELSLAESGQLAFDVVAVDVCAVAQQTVDAMRGAAACALQGPERDPVFARADPLRLRQVLRNLLQNAITHTPPSGSVRVEVEARAGEVGILVQDTGRGIPAEHLQLVWERFHRVDASRNRAAGGRGLGLAIVKQLVERMGGRVAVTSVESQGSTFEVWLPRAR